MTLLAALLAPLAAAPPLAATEHALDARGANAEVRWAAFRAARAPDAWLLDPELAPAATVLARRADPPERRAWRETRSVTACDGSLAVSVGPARRADGAEARFLTIWERQPDTSWRWVFDGLVDDAGDHQPGALTAACLSAPPPPADPLAEASGVSGDRTLRWRLVRATDRERHRLVADYRTPAGWELFADATVR